MSKQIKFEDIRENDRVRVTLPGEKTVLEFVVVEYNPDEECVGDGRIFALYGWEIKGDLNATIELLERAPEPEPTGVGAVVTFLDPHEGIEHTAVRTLNRMWVDEDTRGWSWPVIAANLLRIPSPGVYVD